MSAYIKYFENGGKTCFLWLNKYNEIWNKIKKTLNTKFHTIPVYGEKYIKAKVRKYNGAIKTNFWGDKIPKEGVHHTCIACISIDSVMRMGKKISTSLFRGMQVQNKEDQDAWIYRR